ncbi:MAG: geranylgeranyl reductase family protein [Dehalococcoidia bacterium]
MTAFDAIVVGAGPGGSTAARGIAERGGSVLLLDRAKFPRDKPCGGGVTVRCAELLPFSIDPIVEDVVSKARLRVRDGRDIERDAGGVLTYMTQRRRLDAFLVDRAQEAGADFRDGQQVTDVRRVPDGTYVVATKAEQHTARVVIGADGANGIVGNRLGYASIPDGAAALEGNIVFPDGVPAAFRGKVVLNFGYVPGGYGWVFPKGDHVNVGVGGWKHAAGPRLRAALYHLCRLYGLDPARLESLRGHTLPMAAPGMTIAAMGSAVIGDAAGLVDPLSGEGIYAALASGTAVAPAVADYLAGTTRDLTGYQAAMEREVLPENHTSSELLEIFQAAPEPFIWLMQHSGAFWKGACDLVRGEATYEGLSYVVGPVSHALLGPTAAVARRVNLKRHPRR